MPLRPDQFVELAVEIRRLYSEAEVVILKKIADRIAKGVNDEGWQEKKLAEIHKQRVEIEGVINKLRKESSAAIDEIIWKSYVGGIVSVDEDLKKVGIDIVNPISPDQLKLLPDMIIGGNFGSIDPRPVQKLIQATNGTLELASVQVLRQADDVYRRVISQTVGTDLVGAETRRDAAQRALNSFASKGVVNFVDKSGRAWDLASYTEMATRTATTSASIEGFMGRMDEQNKDLVIISEHMEECSLCAPWEGKILSRTGNTPGYLTVQDAVFGGLWHPNCGHRAHAYIPDLTEPIEKVGDPGGYEERQQQRYMERMVRDWKKREAIAITESEQAKASAKVREWQGRLREFTNEHDRAREYDRESITRAR